MKVVIPLAGPDLVHPEFGLKPLHDLRGVPLLRAALEGRPWRIRGEVVDSDLIFVLREGEDLLPLRAFITAAYPGARIVTLTHVTGGALFSCMAGAAAFAGDAEPLCIDLADILYEWPGYAPEALWAGDVSAVAPIFESSDPAFSYLRFENGQVVEAAEKQAISTSASVGTYLFADLGTMLRASAHIFEQSERWTRGGVHFVCPILNGVLAQGRRVSAPYVTSVVPVSSLFHPSGDAAA